MLVGSITGLMSQPFGDGNSVEWAHQAHQAPIFFRNQSVAEVYGKMLGQGVDYAVAFDDDALVGLISFRMLSAALSARFGQALFADKLLGKAHVPRVIFGPLASGAPDLLIPLIIPLDQAAIVDSSLDFFAAQKKSRASPSGAQFRRRHRDIGSRKIYRADFDD